MHKAQHSERRTRGWAPVAVTAVIGFVLGLGVAWGVGRGGDSLPPNPSVVQGAPTDTASRSAASPDAASQDATAIVPEISAPPVTSAEPEALPSTAFDTQKYSLDDPDSPWVVVNKARPLDPKQFVPSDLVEPAKVRFADAGMMRKDAADALAAMHAAAVADGLEFRGSSAFRGFERQRDIYSVQVAKFGVARADVASARAGYSEHQTGLSADLYDSSACRLKMCFGDSEVGKWVAENGPEYGFIIRYPEGESSVTGYKYEPWHVRYVGVDLATEMRDSAVATLEEFFGLPDAPEYLS